MDVLELHKEEKKVVNKGTEINLNWATEVGGLQDVVIFDLMLWYFRTAKLLFWRKKIVHDVSKFCTILNYFSLIAMHMQKYSWF
jgi:hypothetical protein